MSASGEDLDVDSLARVQFFATTNSPEEGLKTTFLPVGFCKDIYADRMDEAFFENEFSQGEWICPDISEITIFNNPFLFENGRNFVMVVNDCPTAVA